MQMVFSRVLLFWARHRHLRCIMYASIIFMVIANQFNNFIQKEEKASKIAQN